MYKQLCINQNDLNTFDVMQQNKNINWVIGNLINYLILVVATINIMNWTLSC